MAETDQLVEWAKRLQSIAQAGLTYGQNKFDLERYQAIRDISAEMMACKSGNCIILCVRMNSSLN